MTADDGFLHGLIPPLTTPLTPDGQVDEPSLERLCAFLITAGVDGLFVGGSSGETALLSDSQRYLAIEVAASAAAGRVPVVAGAIDTGTARVIDLALQLGAHGQVPGLGNVDPDGYLRLDRAAADGDWGRSGRRRRYDGPTDIRDCRSER